MTTETLDNEITTLIIEDEDGNEKEASIIASFRDNADRIFVVYCLTEDTQGGKDEVEVYASILDEEKEEFVAIESEEDWDLVQEFLDSFNEQEPTE